ncbi:LppP/LprE family lipoprotein [Alicyclobacillus dauci]|uniref:LppP/LprE family lipoprotein n=1 Tax=Alicyclobacillus dauci TaxID=1475485 RepID=A0ABY6Z557_9BACL|nr:LppP/LprE family lipoprotein [Alicyclobacillus dauci]WAH37792.1 LppP/LprE family lipoprotein [Alicyclobacillus dauci]
MRLKTAGMLTGLAATGFVLSQVATATSVMAAPSVAQSPTHIYIDGTNVSNPVHVVAMDPWGDNKTSWVPIFYLQQALSKAVVQTKWNGSDLTIIPPASWTIQPNNLKTRQELKNGEMDFIVGNNQYEIAPKLVEKDPSSGVSTTYVPVYYADQALSKALGMEAAWDGLNWSINTQSTILPTSVVANVMDATTEVGQPTVHFGTPSNQVTVATGQGKDTISAVVGLRSPSGDGTGQLVFFFHNKQFIGLNANVEAIRILSVKPDGQGRIQVTYANYASSDPMVKPSLPPQTVTYTWNGSTMTPSATLDAGVTFPTQVTAPAPTVSSSLS